MKIAVTYDNGNIFQHFGRTEQFKVYEVEDNKIISSEVVGSNGIGHGALAGLLAGQDIQVLICGGHHECCGGHGHDDGGEDHGCCCGGGPRYTVEGRNAGKGVRVHYRGTFDDGTQFDSSYDRGEPLSFVCGTGMMILGFDKAVAEMEVGQIVDVHLTPEEAYGYSDPEAIVTIEITQLPGSENLSVGDRVMLKSYTGQPFPVTVTAKDDTTITLDANHEMAGKELNFRIELLEVQ